MVRGQDIIAVTITVSLQITRLPLNMLVIFSTLLKFSKQCVVSILKNELIQKG